MQRARILQHAAGYLMLVTMAHAGSLPDALTNAGRCAGIQSSPVVRKWAELFTQDVGSMITNGSASPAAGASIGAIDSTQSEVGPIIQNHAQTIGDGNVNTNLIVSRVPLTKFEGMDLHNLHGPGAIILQDTRGITNQTGGRIVASQLKYDIDARTIIYAPSATYGVTEDLDLSLLLPIISIGANVDGSNRPVAVLSAGAFEPLAGPTTISRDVGNEVGFGDLLLRAKYHVEWLPGTDIRIRDWIPGTESAVV